MLTDSPPLFHNLIAVFVGAALLVLTMAAAVGLYCCYRKVKRQHSCQSPSVNVSFHKNITETQDAQDNMDDCKSDPSSSHPEAIPLTSSFEQFETKINFETKITEITEKTETTNINVSIISTEQVTI